MSSAHLRSACSSASTSPAESLTASGCHVFGAATLSDEGIAGTNVAPIAATLLLLVRRQAGYLVAGAVAAGLLAFEVVDGSIFGFRWLDTFYMVIAVIILLVVFGLEFGSHAAHLHSRSTPPPAHARR
jgi:hypothetical protein